MKSIFAITAAVALASSAVVNGATVIVDEFSTKTAGLYPAVANVVTATPTVIGVDAPLTPTTVIGGGRVVSVGSPSLIIPGYDRTTLDIFTGNLGGGRVGALAVDTTAGAKSAVILEYGSANANLTPFTGLTLGTGVALNIDFRLYDAPVFGTATTILSTTFLTAGGPEIAGGTYSTETLTGGSLSIPLSFTGAITGIRISLASDEAVDYLIDRITLDGNFIVPEPTSMGGLLGTSMLLLRRRRA